MISYWPFKEKIVPIPCLSECIEGLKMCGGGGGGNSNTI